MLCAHEVVQTFQEEGAWPSQLFKGAGFPGLEPALHRTQPAECGLCLPFFILTQGTWTTQTTGLQTTSFQGNNNFSLN